MIPVFTGMFYLDFNFIIRSVNIGSRPEYASVSPRLRIQDRSSAILSPSEEFPVIIFSVQFYSFCVILIIFLTQEVTTLFFPSFRFQCLSKSFMVFFNIFSERFNLILFFLLLRLFFVSTFLVTII